MRPRAGARRLGLPVPPLAPSLAVAGELLDALTANDGVMRAATTTAGNRRYTGGDIPAQAFLMPASPQRGDSDVVAAGAGLSNSRNALNRRRGVGR